MNKEEEVDLSDYESYTDAVRQIGHFLSDVHMHKRIHWSPGYIFPVEFEGKWLSAQDLTVVCTKNRPKPSGFWGVSITIVRTLVEAGEWRIGCLTTSTHLRERGFSRNSTR